MTSSRKLVTNRKNAQRSTGPRTKARKSTSRLNVINYGLALPADALPAFASDTAQVAQALTGEAACNPAIRKAAVRVVEAITDVLRARRAKMALLDRLVHDPAFPSAPAERAAAPGEEKYSRVAHPRAICDGREEPYLDASFAAKAARTEHRRQAHQRAADRDHLEKHP